MALPQQMVATRKSDGQHGQQYSKGEHVTDFVANVAFEASKAMSNVLMATPHRTRKGSPAPAATASVNNLQTRMLIRYEAMAGDFVAFIGAPPVRVTNIRGDYYIWLDKPIVDSRAQPIQPEAPAERAHDARDIKSYSAKTWGITRYVSDEEVQNENDDAVMSIARAVQYVYQANMQRLEDDFSKEVAAADSLDYKITGVAGVNAAPVPGALSAATTTKWSDHGQTENANVTTLNSSPIFDVYTAATEVHKNTGGETNVLLVGPNVETGLISHPEIVGRLNRGQTSGVALPDLGDLNRVFRIGNVVVAKARESTSEYFMGNNGVLLTAPPDKGAGDRSAFMTALFGPEGSDGMGVTIRTWYSEERAATAIEGRMCYDIVKQDAKGGVSFRDIV